jgi:hypothetical protein
VENGELVFHDLAREHGLNVQHPLHVAWSRFDNQTNQKSPISSAEDFHVPESAGSSYLAADLWRGDDKAKTVTVYLKIESPAQVVGIDRTW